VIEVHAADTGEPYLDVSLTLGPAIIADMLACAPRSVGRSDGQGFSVAAVTPEMLDAWVRLMRLIRASRTRSHRVEAARAAGQRQRARSAAEEGGARGVVRAFDGNDRQITLMAASSSWRSRRPWETCEGKGNVLLIRDRSAPPR